MAPQSGIDALRAKIEVLWAKNEDLEKELKEPGISEAEELAIYAQMTANTNLMTEYQRRINATITTPGDISRH